ncbi:MAG: Activator of Hsp90 ATPase 1 family protein [Actinomycetia bacterium]|nr:Activator of Hsp90 ATPase 1 family protein [Actinomycetes bacterium]
MEDRIEQRITIRATQDKVWHIVTRPGWWLPGSGAEPARGPGRVAVVHSGDTRPYVIDVVRVEPQGYASFRWASAFGGAQPAPGNATLVEFYLRPVGDETGVTVVESGFTSLDLPDALREDEWKGSKGGWQYELANLRTRAESHVPGERPPVPPAVRPGRS